MQKSTCFNLNFSNPGGTTPLQSLILSKANCSSYEMATADSDAGSKESTPQFMTDIGGNPTPPTSNRVLLPNGKKTKGRVKIKMEYIGNKLRRYTTFSKRKTGIMKKAHELSTLTGTQVMLIVASETGHVYSFATHKLKSLISGEPGKGLIQQCLNAPDSDNDMSAIKTEFTFEPPNNCMNLGASPSVRKRKLDINEEMMTLPTMVSSSSPPLNDYCDSDNDSEESDSRVDEDDQPPVLHQSSVDTIKLINEAMRAASEQRQRQTKPVKPKSQQIRSQNNRNKSQNDVNMQGNPLEQALMAFLASGFNASISPSSTSSSTQINFNCGDSPSTSSKKPRQSFEAKDLELDQPTVLFQLPQGTVYATDNSPTITPPPQLIASSNSPSEGNNANSPLFSATINGTSSSTSSASSANNVEEHNSTLLNSGGNNAQIQQFFELLFKSQPH